MWKVSDINIGLMKQGSDFVKPMQMLYKINGISKKWDFIKIHDSVSIIIYNKDKRALVCCRQFRPAVYVYNIPEEEREGAINIAKYPLELGVTNEFCAGIIDKPDLSVVQIAREEVLEECGYDVPCDRFEKIKQFKGGVGITSEEIHLYFVEVDDSMKVTEGGGVAEEGEFIEIVHFTLDEVLTMSEDPRPFNSYFGFIYGLLWFHTHKMDAHGNYANSVAK